MSSIKRYKAPGCGTSPKYLLFKNDSDRFVIYHNDYFNKLKIKDNVIISPRLERPLYKSPYIICHVTLEAVKMRTLIILAIALAIPSGELTYFINENTYYLYGLILIVCHHVNIPMTLVAFLLS